MKDNFEELKNEQEIWNSFNLALLEENIEYFSKYRDAVEWNGGPQGNGVNQFPYPVYPEGMKLLPLLECMGGFDYDYDKHMKEIIAAKLSPTDLNFSQIQSYITYIIRGEKFCDGHIAEHMQNLVLLKLCLRLDDLVRDSMTRAKTCSYSHLGNKILKSETGEKQNFRYYQLKSGLIFKINQSQMSCYRLNPETKMWKEDLSMFTDFEWGNLLGYQEIQIDDIYEIEVESDNRKGLEIIVGRHKDCDLCIEDPRISRIHALIYYDGAHWLIRDLGSKNGIMLNEKTIQVNVLSEKDKIEIGESEIIFYKEYLEVNSNGKTQMVFLKKKEILNQELQKCKRSKYMGCLLGGAVGGALDNQEKISNSAVMRAVSLGLSVHYDPIYTRGDDANAVYKAVKCDAMITKEHPAAQDALMALAHIAFHIVQYHPTGYRHLEESISGVQIGHGAVEEWLKKAVLLAQDKTVSDFDAIHALGEGRTADEALRIAVFCAVRYQEDFAKAMHTALNHKGDCDTIGTICGSILGAWMGKEAVESVYDIGELADVMETIAENLHMLN